jgi:hypothetical protein
MLKGCFNLFIEKGNPDTIEYVEEFKFMLMNRSNAVPGIMDVSKGGISDMLNQQPDDIMDMYSDADPGL